MTAAPVAPTITPGLVRVLDAWDGVNAKKRSEMHAAAIALLHRHWDSRAEAEGDDRTFPMGARRAAEIVRGLLRRDRVLASLLAGVMA